MQISLGRFACSAQLLLEQGRAVRTHGSMLGHLEILLLRGMIHGNLPGHLLTRHSFIALLPRIKTL